jgi:hypothetical protein
VIEEKRNLRVERLGFVFSFKKRLRHLSIDRWRGYAFHANINGTWGRKSIA